MACLPLNLPSTIAACYLQPMQSRTRSHWAIACLTASVLLSVRPGSAQKAIQSSPILPTAASNSGSEDLERASKVNGLSTIESPPWHLKLSFRVFDQNAGVKDQGTVEILWAGQLKYRTVFTSTHFNQTIIATKFGNLRSGDANAVPEVISYLYGATSRPSKKENPLHSSPPASSTKKSKAWSWNA